MTFYKRDASRTGWRDASPVLTKRDGTGWRDASPVLTKRDGTGDVMRYLS